MPDPYRDQDHRCPACVDSALREFQGRLVCDACSGLHITQLDLIGAIRDLTGLDPQLEFFKDTPGKRACPWCAQSMIACRLRIAFPTVDKDPKTKPTLDRCDAHGIWFDTGELVKVFETVRHVASAGPHGGGGGGISGVTMPGNGFGWGFGAK